MRLLLNCALVILGVPVLGTSFLLIAHFLPVSAHGFAWPSHIYAIAYWLVSLVLFSFVYITRTKWLERTGMFGSWPNFQAYVIESHGYPPVSVEEKREFLSWAGLPEERPPNHRKMARSMYKDIRARLKTGELSEEKYRSYVKSLAWYLTPWPLHDDFGEEQ
jgi:hypothetical protein